MPRHNPSLVGAKLSRQSARTPKQICSLLSRLASSRRFPATNTASSGRAVPAWSGSLKTASLCAIPARRKPLAVEPKSASQEGSRCPEARRDASDSGSTSCRKRLIPHSTPHSRRLLSRKRRPRRGRQRRPPPTARPQRCGPGAGCEGSPQEAAALQSRRQWRHLGGR